MCALSAAPMPLTTCLAQLNAATAVLQRAGGDCRDEDYETVVRALTALERSLPKPPSTP